MAIKIGNLDISSFKVGVADCSIYLGDTKLYPSEEPTPPTPSFDGKWLATYTGGATSSAECDASSATTYNEISTTDLVAVEIGDCVTSIGNSTFYGYNSLTSVTISNSVTNIEAYVFYDCTSLTEVTIGSGVTSIAQYVFQNCSSLTSVTIPNSVTSIRSSAFRNCTSLTSVTIGSGVTSIGSRAFDGCSSLTSVTVNATTPPTLDATNVFANTNNCPIYVPATSVNAYRTANIWSQYYASRIRAIS